MSKLEIIRFVAVIVLLNVAKLYGIVNIDPEKKQHIDNFVNGLLFDCEKHNVVGMNLALVHEGKALYTTGYGLRNLESGERVTENTVYYIASTGKHFTTTLTGQLLKDAGYSWDTKVRDILADLGTDFHFFDPLRSNLTNLRDLASHSTGMFGSDYIWFPQNMTREELVSRLRFTEGTYEPRTTFLYNNLMFVLLGHVAELLAGRNFEDLVQTEIFDKVGMANSSFIYYIDEESAELATAYLLAPVELREVEWEAISEAGPDMAPAGAIASTANDMARWMNVLLSGGQNEAGEEVFSPEVIAEISSPVNAYSSYPDYLYSPPSVPVKYEYWSSYGLGIGQGSYRGYRALMHPGTIYGQYTQYHLFPDAQLGIYTSVNGVQGGQYSAMDQIAMFAADVVLEKEPWLNSTTACSFPEPFYNTSDLPAASPPVHSDVSFSVLFATASSTAPIAQKKMNQFLGQYGNFAYGNLTITVDDVRDELVMNFDVLSCTLRNATERVICFGQDEYWFTALDDVIFDDLNYPSKYVDVLFSPIQDYVRFERNLSLADAPGPTDHWPQCSDVSSNNGVHESD